MPRIAHLRRDIDNDSYTYWLQSDDSPLSLGTVIDSSESGVNILAKRGDTITNYQLVSSGVNAYIALGEISEETAQQYHITQNTHTNHILEVIILCPTEPIVDQILQIPPVLPVIQEELFCTCNECGKIMSDEAHYNMEGNSLCGECYNRLTVHCHHCTEQIWLRAAILYGRSRFLCQDCRDEHYYSCENCSDIINEDEVCTRSGINYCGNCDPGDGDEDEDRNNDRNCTECEEEIDSTNDKTFSTMYPTLCIECGEKRMKKVARKMRSARIMKLVNAALLTGGRKYHRKYFPIDINENDPHLTTIRSRLRSLCYADSPVYVYGLSNDHDYQIRVHNNVMLAEAISLNSDSMGIPPIYHQVDEDGDNAGRTMIGISRSLRNNQLEGIINLLKKSIKVWNKRRLLCAA